eukprot:TRINITY_DN9785_c0_g1_i1.p1 TRINITY_DN9785_c0_g1~~TRINITY_DN9785_c0_g1_i1.p1  ORF type:complete len:284 (+),score=51.10 TRINITY_DN9785_c0_g1_i1:88-939(+)
MSDQVKVKNRYTKRFEKLGLVEGQEITEEVFERIWFKYNEDQSSIGTGRARKFLRDLSRINPEQTWYDSSLADELIEEMDPLGIGIVSYDQFCGLLLKLSRKTKTNIAPSFRGKLVDKTRVPFVEVKLNIYDLFDLGRVNDQTIHFGFGAFHSAVEIFGIEISFGYPAGVYSTEPRMSDIGKFRECLPMGEISLSIIELRVVIDELRCTFTPETYNISTHNCHDFCDALCMVLVRHHIPSRLNNLPKFIKFFQYVLTEDILVDRGETKKIKHPSSRLKARQGS